MDLDDLRRQLKTGELYAPKPKLTQEQLWELVRNSAELSFEEWERQTGISAAQLANQFAADVMTQIPPVKRDREAINPCDRCEARPAYYWPSMTAYEWNGKGENPNADKILCQMCGEEYTQIMKEQWDEYNAGRL